MTGEAGKADSKLYTGLLSNVTTTKTDQEKENPGRVKSLCRTEKCKAAEPVVPLARRLGEMLGDTVIFLSRTSAA